MRWFTVVQRLDVSRMPAIMKTVCLLVLVFALFGCTTGRLETATLTSAQATVLSQKLANDKAQALYSCRPFSNGPLARLADGLWVWRDRRGLGQGDIEATVKFARDGTNPSVSVVLLDSRTILQ